MKKKLVHLIPQLGRGGAERFLVELAVRSVSDYEVYVVCQYAENDEEYVKRLTDAGATVIALDKKVGVDIKAMFAMSRELRKIKPDVVHSHLTAGVYALSYYMFHRKCRKIHTVHSMPSKEIPRFHRSVMSFFYKCLGVTPVSITDTVQSEMCRLYRLRAANTPIIYNGVCLEDFSVERVPHDGFEFICVANFSPWKNQKLLAEAFLRLSVEERDNVRLRFIGDGECRSEVEQMLKDTNAIFEGRRENVADYLARADVLCLSSDFEGLPLVVLEAYAAGLPVLATNVGAMGDILKNSKNGVLVSPNDAEAMRVGMRFMLDNPEKAAAMGSYNTKWVKSFGIDECTHRYMELYNG